MMLIHDEMRITKETLERWGDPVTSIEDCWGTRFHTIHFPLALTLSEFPEGGKVKDIRQYLRKIGRDDELSLIDSNVSEFVLNQIPVHDDHFKQIIEI